MDPLLPLRQQAWFHGSVSRTEAERLLTKHKEGSYLVRQSESKKEVGDFERNCVKLFFFFFPVRTCRLIILDPSPANLPPPPHQPPHLLYQDYSLSLRSAKGFMHMKIVRQDDKYILGQFSQPYSSIPDMIHHYGKNKLPIKGATHMSLLHPVKDELL